MKKSKILAPALAILCLSTAASVTGTVAWFAANNVVNATGMNIHAQASYSLVINNEIPVGIAKTVSLTKAEAASLSPTTFVSYDDASADYGILKHSTVDGELIDDATGLPFLSTTPMTYSNSIAESHYTDFVCYIASAGDAIQSGTLSAAISNTNAATIENTLAACSVAFFVSYVTEASDATPAARTDYVGSLNLAQINPEDSFYVSEAAAARTAKTSQLLYTAAVGNTIPNAPSGEAVRVTMRVYFDGALLQASSATYSGNVCYVRTGAINISELNLTAEFTYVE